MSSESALYHPHVAVVIPCFRVRDHVLDVVARIGPEVRTIVAVDDACPEGSGELLTTEGRDPRVVVVRLPVNQGVGGAVLAGYRRAVDLGATVIVKIDGDGQMDPRLIPQFIRPIIEGQADYTKGNRFFDLDSLRGMPPVRLLGNAGLSFITKLSSGYWKVMDPTNGYTAIDARVATALPHRKIASRYFFESDMLFRLNTLRAVVWDVPMDATYGDERSNLRVQRVLLEFPLQHLKRFLKRVAYSYFVRDFNAASVQLLGGLCLLATGAAFGLSHWSHYASLGISAPTGTIVLATLQVILGVQFLLGWVTHDMNDCPLHPIASRLLVKRSSDGVDHEDAVG